MLLFQFNGFFIFHAVNIFLAWTDVQSLKTLLKSESTIHFLLFFHRDNFGYWKRIFSELFMSFLWKLYFYISVTLLDGFKDSSLVAEVISASPHQLYFQYSFSRFSVQFLNERWWKDGRRENSFFIYFSARFPWEPPNDIKLYVLFSSQL